MTRMEFMRRLQRGLRGAPREVLAAIVLDYEGYFDDGVRAGRSEAELALALGDPGRVASELRLEVDARQWEADRTMAVGLRIAAGALGLALVDSLLLGPLCLAVILCAAGILSTIALALAGCYVLVISPFDDPAGGLAAAILHGIGLIAGGVAGAAGLSLASTWLIDALSWYGRVHRRAFRPLFLPQKTNNSGQPS